MKKFGPELLSRLNPRPYWWRYALTYVALFMGSVLAKTNVRGRHNLPKKGPFVVACNHFSDHDPLFFSYAIRKPINFIAASDQEIEIAFIWAPFIYGWIPVDRKNLSPSTIKKSVRALREKEILGIFPDGGVNYDLLSKPKNGAVFLSTVGKCPIVPMSIYGAERSWEGLLKGIRSRVQINIGKSFGPYELKGDRDQKNKKMKKVGQEMMGRIASLLPEDRRGAFTNDDSILKYQKENEVVPSQCFDFKPKKQ